MLEREFQYFLDNKEQLAKKYPSKYIVIKGEEVVGVYDNEMDAYFGAQKKHPLGTFLIQLCTTDQEAYTQNFTSRAIFA